LRGANGSAIPRRSLTHRSMGGGEDVARLGSSDG
jgi:hypothetical protein